MWFCASCGLAVQPGCRGVPGTDGFLSASQRPDGRVQMAAYHWRQDCRDARHAGQATAGLRVLRFDRPADAKAAATVAA